MKSALTLAVVLLALFESSFELTAKFRSPTEKDWTAAAAEVRAGFREGDLIVFAPGWVDPIGRSYLGDLIPVEMAGRADSDRYRNIWEIAIRNDYAADAVTARLLSESKHGALVVRHYEKGAVEVLYDFTSRAADARVASGETPCFADPKQPTRFRCGATVVEPRTLEVDYAPRRGILAPVTNGPLTISFPEAQLGTKLVGYTGLHDYYSRKNADGPVDLKIFIDGQLKESVHHLQREGWRRFTIDTVAGQHDVRFEVSTTQPAWRTFGFHAESRR